jgi:hypothetical protein
MAEFFGTILTSKGLKLLAKVQTGQELYFSKVMFGDGVIPEGQDYRDITQMISPKLELARRSVTVVGDGTSKLQVILSNEGLSEGFFAKEMGVYATDPDEGEILYAYDYAGDKSDFIAAEGHANPLNVPVDIYFVIGQATNLTVTVGSGLYALEDDFQEHIADSDPHPNFLKIGLAVTDCSNVIVQQSDARTIHPMGFDVFKAKVLGGDGTDISIMRGRIDQTERELSNIALLLEAQQTYPDYNALIAEDFVIPDAIDTFSCAVASIVAGDDSIDLATLQGIVPGSWYTVTDGVNQEYVQIKSVVKNGSVLRVILQAAIVNTYTVAQTEFYRTTAQLITGAAQGAGDKRAATWQPTTVWQGVNANNPVVADLNTTQGNIGAFTISGDIAFTADGFVTLV